MRDGSASDQARQAVHAWCEARGGLVARMSSCAGAYPRRMMEGVTSSAPRRLRGPQPHLPVRHDDTGRTLVSRRLAVELSQRHPTVVHRAAEPVACDVATRILLVDLDELQSRLPPALPRPRASV